MKRILFYIIASLVAIQSHANIIAKADSAYLSDNFAEAVQLYEQALEELGPSAERYYNLGNAYYRQGQLGAAILNYERSLRLDPSNKDARENLEFVNSKTVDHIETTESFVSALSNKIGQMFTPNVWAYIALALFILTLVGAGIYFISQTVSIRKIGFFGGLSTLLLCIIANVIAYQQTVRATTTNEAIIMVKSINLSTTPRTPMNRSEEAILLHEGTKLYILNSITPGEDTWYDVKIDDSHRAWIPADAIEII